MDRNSEYEKIPKSLKPFDFSENEVNELNKLKWVVTEKVHGANFSFTFEGRKLLFAKRKEYLSWNSDFFGFQEVASKIEDNIVPLFEQLSLDLKADKYMVYGELFGGKYPHPEVPVYPNTEAIQTGVYYSPSVEFCAFDIAFEKDEVKSYLDYETAIAYFEKFGIFYAKILFSGKLNEAMDFNLRINSTIPSQLKLPEIANNLIEGVVIKPLKNATSKNLTARPIIKLKNTEFEEDNRFHEAKKWSFIPKVASKSEELSFLIEEMYLYINENRVNSAISKIGRLDFNNEQRLNAIRLAVLEDVWNDFNIDNNNIIKDLYTEKQDWIKQRLKMLINEQIMRYC